MIQLIITIEEVQPGMIAVDHRAVRDQDTEEEVACAARLHPFIVAAMDKEARKMAGHGACHQVETPIDSPVIDDVKGILRNGGNPQN